jgi:hypothetical protein
MSRRQPKAGARGSNLGAGIAAGAGGIAGAAVLLYHHYVDSFQFLLLAVGAAVVGGFVLVTGVMVVVSDLRYRASLPKVRSTPSVGESPLDVSPPQAVKPLEPREIDLLTVSKILRLFGWLSAVICFPAATFGLISVWPAAIARLYALAALLTAGQVAACFVVAGRLRNPTKLVRLAAAVLLCLELPAFPLTLWALQGLFCLYRGSRPGVAATA